MSEIVRPVEADGWPMCPTPDCDAKVCLWGSTGYCFRCSVVLVGQLEMDRRYAVTRISPTDLRWTGIPWGGPPSDGP
jgi:hypothetical protein